MTINQLKEKLNKLSPEYGPLDALVQDPNNTGFYGLSGNIRIEWCDSDGWLSDEDDKDTEKVVIL